MSQDDLVSTNPAESQELQDFYKRILLPLTQNHLAQEALTTASNGTATREDYTLILQKDVEVAHWVRLHIQRSGYGERATTLEQMMTVLGEERVFHALMGRFIERSFVPFPKSLVGKIIEKADKKKPPAKAPTQTKSPDQNPEAAAPNEEENEIIPELKDLEGYIPFSLRAHEAATQIRNSYPGMAFSAGYLWDLVFNLFKYSSAEQITEKTLKPEGPFFKGVFDDGLRAAIAAATIVEKIHIPHQKYVFSTALLHNIGKALLLCFDPVRFEKVFHGINESRKNNPLAKTSPIEQQHFLFDHSQAGALYLGRFTQFQDIEAAVDFHHDPHLLRFQNSKLHALSCVLRVAFRLAKVYERTRGQEPNINKLKDSDITQTEEFRTIKLNVDEWKWIKTEYVHSLKKAGL